MSTQRRIDSSRAIGAKSHGPVTPEGRARSRAARLTHGLTSEQLLIDGESEEEFNAFREEYIADYQPQTRSQFDLVDQLVAIRWRLNRVISLQGALMDIQMARQQPEIDKEFQSCGGDIRAAIAYQHLCDDSRALESLRRHEARLSAEFRRTFKLLAAELKNQKFHHEPSSAKPPHPDEDGDAAEPPPSTTDHPPPRKPHQSLRPSTINDRPSTSAEQRATSDPQRGPKLAEVGRVGKGEPCLLPPVSCLLR